MANALGRLLAVLEAALAGLDDAQRFAAAIGDVPRTVDRPRAESPFSLPVCSQWEAALVDAAPVALTAPLRALGPALAWSQNPNYRRRPPDPAFLDSYGYAVIAGPARGAPALVTHEGVALGVLLLGPRTHYPRHAHPAAEVYVPLNTAEWWRGAGPWAVQPPGRVIHHPPNLPHATRTGAGPLLAIYLWLGDLATDARLSST